MARRNKLADEVRQRPRNLRAIDALDDLEDD